MAAPRSLPLLAGILILAAIPTACDRETPTEAGTVRLALIADADHGGRPMATDLTQELSTTVTGDPDGVGSALVTLNAGTGEVCWETSASNIALPATASHIHHGVAGISGPIVVPLSPPDASGHASGCRTGVDRELIRSILTSPDSFYVNVHTTQFPAGAIRGQLP